MVAELMSTRSFEGAFPGVAATLEEVTLSFDLAGIESVGALLGFVCPDRGRTEQAMSATVASCMEILTFD